MQNFTSEKIESALQNHGNRLYRLCLVMLGNESDAEDTLQETMIRYLQKAPTFVDTDHEKAWLIKVASNICRDTLRCRKRQPLSLPDEWLNTPLPTENKEILEALCTLPEKYKLVLILHYVEGYRINEIAEIIEKTPSAVKMRLQKGRKLLETAYRKECL